MSGAAPKAERPLTPRSLDDDDWAWFSHASLIRARTAAGYNGVALLCALAAKAPFNGADFKASTQNLAALSGLSLRTVQRVLPVLAQARVVAIQSGKGRGPGGVDTANTFRLLRVILSSAEGGGSHSPTPSDRRPRVSRLRASVPTQSTSLAEERDISADRQRDVSAPTAPAVAAGAAASPGHGAEEEKQEASHDPNAW